MALHQDTPRDPKARVRALLAEWQAQDNTPRLPPLPARGAETPTQALFRKWEMEDATMTAPVNRNVSNTKSRIS